LLKKCILVAFRTKAGRLVVFRAVNVGTVVERSVLAFDWLPSFLVRKMPVEAREWPVLRTLVLQKLWTLLRAELVQISTIKNA